MTEDATKIVWANCLKSAGTFDAGCLNIGSIKAKNLALLAKWWWRFKSERSCLWTSVITSIYWQDGGFGGVSRMKYGSPWASIIQAAKHIDTLGVPLSNSFERVVHSGSDTSFWHDHWLINGALCDKFKRLFALEMKLIIRWLTACNGLLLLFLGFGDGGTP